jgi:hypothetical protein
MRVSTGSRQPKCVMVGGEEVLHVQVERVEERLATEVPVWSPGRNWVEVRSGHVWARRTACGTFELLGCARRQGSGDGELWFTHRGAPREALIGPDGMGELWWLGQGGASYRVPAEHRVRAYRAALAAMDLEAELDNEREGIVPGTVCAAWVEHRGDRAVRPGWFGKPTPTFVWHVLVRTMEGETVPPLRPTARTVKGQPLELSCCDGCDEPLLPYVNGLAWPLLGVDPRGEDKVEDPIPPF